MAEILEFKMSVKETAKNWPNHSSTILIPEDYYTIAICIPQLNKRFLAHQNIFKGFL